MICTSNFDVQDTVTTKDVAEFITSAALAICSTYHMALGCTPGQAIFGGDMICNIADWKKVLEHRQILLDQNNVQENKNRIDFDNTLGQQVLLIKEGIQAESRHQGPFVITKLHCYGTVRIQFRNISEQINIKSSHPTSTRMVNSMC